jgi:hypothetical protein
MECPSYNISFDEEAKAILHIPLSLMLPKDRLIWRCTKNEEINEAKQSEGSQIV